MKVRGVANGTTRVEDKPSMENMRARCGESPTLSSLENDTFEFGPQTEKWYGVDYYVSPVDQKHISPWKASDDEEMAFHLPKPNRYIPRTLGLSEDLPDEAKVQRIDKAIDPPKLIVNKPSGRLWWRLDDRYALPKASLTLLFRTATAENKFTLPLGWEFDTGINRDAEMGRSSTASGNGPERRRQ